MKKNKFFAIVLCGLIAILSAGCSNPELPISSRTTHVNSIVSIDPNNSWDWVGNIHTAGLDYISAHYSMIPTNNAWANDFYSKWLGDSLALNSGTYEEWVDSSAVWGTSKTLAQWNSQALAAGGISQLAKVHLDGIANLFDSLDIYDSSSFMGRVTQIETDVNTTVSADSDKQAILSVLSIGRASYLYWTYQFNNPSLSNWPVSRWLAIAPKGGAQPGSIRSHSDPAFTQRQKNIINTDLYAAGGSLAKDIAVTVFTTLATGGTATVPTTAYVATKALATGLGASAWYALWH